MKLTPTKGNILSSTGVEVTSAFNIARTPHMFNILSSGLYSDKIAAVLREIGCNAMDAHIMGGIPDKPFQVKLPTALDRSFFVRDWGPGLDDNEVRNLYTTYGMSTKQENEDVTGAFGLGSKSPFAYTLENEDDSTGFTVTAVKDGVKRIYTCHLGDEGTPAVSMLYEGPADEDWPHGVMVSFPVQVKDTEEFQAKAVEVFRWFNVPPEILGLGKALVKPTFALTGRYFGLQPNEGYHSDVPAVVMGNVRYPLNTARLGELTATERALLNSKVHLMLPLGEVMMTPSREELQYTDRTRTNIKKYLAKATLHVAATIRDAVMREDLQPWQWAKAVQQYVSNLPSSMSLALSEFLQEAGVAAEEAKRVLSVVKDRTTELPRWVGDGIDGPVAYEYDAEGRLLRDERGAPVLARQQPEGARVWHYTLSTNRRSASRAARQEVQKGLVRSGSDYKPLLLAYENDVCVFYVDCKQAEARVKAAVLEGLVHSALVVTPCKGSSPAFVQQYAERLASDGVLCGIPLAPASSLPIPDSVGQAKAKRKQLKQEGARIFFGNHEAMFLTSEDERSTRTLRSLQDDELFYLVTSNPQRLSNRLSNIDSQGNKMVVERWRRAEVLKALSLVADSLGIPFKGAILVSTEAAARRLKLQEQGIKPLLPTLRDAFYARDVELAEKLDSLDCYPRVDLKENYPSKQYGWMGVLARQLLLDTPASQKVAEWLKEKLQGTALLNEIQHFMKRAMSPEPESNDEIRRLQRAVNELRESAYMRNLPQPSDARITSTVLCSRAYELAPNLRMLDREELMSALVSEEEQPIAFALLSAALGLNSVVVPEAARQAA